MSKRTTILLDKELYEELVKESLRRYGTVKALSKVLNSILLETFKGKREMLRLIYSEKAAKTTCEEFEKFRRELSRRLES
ncbi:MAG: hypothetical protein AOA66_0900 [Candidatus Bathyarchaeota archaeon BA2]|nr:MAG: hypothetical protein AOA66_0900 [Candidatus Bathyarchaeota archaeon BA2]